MSTFLIYIIKIKIIMDKVNEFVNNDDLKEIFDKLDRDIFIETAHLANFFQLEDNKHYKIMLENINNFLPFIVDKIINGEYRYVHKLLISKVFDVDKDNFIGSVSNWWKENKFKYGK
jgi:hypothetical protein